MPRATTVELLYLPLPEEAKEVGAAKEAFGGYKEIAYNVDQPAEPILFRLYIPKITVKKLNATVTFFVVDATVAGKTQIIAEATAEGITAASNTGPVLVERRIIPERDFTEEPGKEGRRLVTLEVECSSESVTIPKNTAKTVCFFQIMGLGRQ